MKKCISILLCLVLVLACLPIGANAAKVVWSSQNLTVNGRPVDCEKYNIDGSNYFKLRDIAYLLSGTASQFEVGYDPETRTVTITSGLPYTPNGEELIVGMDKSSTAQPSTQSIMIDGAVNSEISAYNLAGNNFFKLRDLGDVLGFTVDYDKPSNTAIILSSSIVPAPSPESTLEPKTDYPTELNAEQVYEKCSSAVFYIEVANRIGEVYATGSGFFISSDGTAVTNYHVINGAYSAKITLSTTKQQYTVVGVYDYDANEDWAILKIDGSGFPYLEIAEGATVIGGAKCYAIGSPQGLQNTISDGIISNPAQDLGGVSFIQISAAISHGSSGGALINKYGQVIGITSAGYEEGENLGFAIPISVINGYSHDKCTELSELVSNSNNYDDLSAQNAYDYLIAFVKAYYNDTQSDLLIYSYEEKISTGSISRQLVYDLSTERISILVFEKYYDQRYYTIISLHSDSYIHTVTYSFYDNSNNQGPAFRAYNYVYAPGFYGDNLEFTEVDVNTGYDVAINESCASIFLKIALSFADSILYNYRSDYGVYLFGFTDYDSPTPEPTPEPTPDPTPDPGPRSLSSKEVFDQCSPAVFYIETYDIVGEAYATGSGFFIDESGIAVTNHHVLKNAISAKITLANGEVHDLAGVLYFDRDNDYAVIKVDGSGFATLKAGDASALSGGDVCYAIGSPKGLQNTISDGIISSSARTDLGRELIQMTAPISAGSSGGALINEFGEVVGVTTSSLLSGQNLNFAIPINTVVDNGKIQAYKNGGTLQTLPKFAEENAYLDYASLPGMHVRGLQNTGGYLALECGDTAYGTVKGDSTDLYYVYCNTVGHIEAYLVTNAGTRYAQDITITGREYMNYEDFVFADYATFTDGSEGQYLSCTVSKPGVYVLSVFSYELHKTEAVNMDYAIYYVFVPGDTLAPNTTGDMGGEPIPRQQLAFNALKTWIQANYNETIDTGDQLCKCYLEERALEEGAYRVVGVILGDEDQPDYENIALYYGYWYPDGASSYAFIFLFPDEPSFYSSFSYSEASCPEDKESFFGSTHIVGSDYSGRKNVNFEEVSGISAYTLDRALMTRIAMLSFSSALQYAEILYQSYLQPNGAYSISDFGFDPNDLDVP